MSASMQDTSCKTARWLQLKNLLNNLNGPAFLEQIQADPKAVVIDVRTCQEFAQGSLPQAVNIDFFSEDFWEQLEALNPDKTYYVLCRSGRRSIRVCTYLRNSGFKHLYNLDGGIKNADYFSV